MLSYIIIYKLTTPKKNRFLVRIKKIGGIVMEMRRYKIQDKTTTLIMLYNMKIVILILIGKDC